MKTGWWAQQPTAAPVLGHATCAGVWGGGPQHPAAGSAPRTQSAAGRRILQVQKVRAAL